MKSLKEWCNEYDIFNEQEMVHFTGTPKSTLQLWCKTPNKHKALTAILIGASEVKKGTPSYNYDKFIHNLFKREPGLGSVVKYKDIPGTDGKYLFCRSGSVIGRGERSFRTLKPIKRAKEKTYRLIINGNAEDHKVKDLMKLVFGVETVKKKNTRQYKVKAPVSIDKYDEVMRSFSGLKPAC